MVPLPPHDFHKALLRLLSRRRVVISHSPTVSCFIAILQWLEPFESEAISIASLASRCLVRWSVKMHLLNESEERRALLVSSPG